MMDEKNENTDLKKEKEKEYMQRAITFEKGQLD